MPQDPYGFGNYFYDVSSSYAPQQPAPQTQAQEQGKLEWIAAINGQSVDEYLNTQAAYQQQDDPIYTQLARSTSDAYGREIQAMEPWQQALNDNYTTNSGTRQQIVDTQRSGLNAATSANNTHLQNMQNSANATAGYTNDLLGSYSSALNNANAMDAGTVGQLGALNGSMRQLTAQGYGADVVSDPSLVGAQQNVYDALGGFASGQYNVTSQAALATADQEALDAQKHALGEFKERIDPRLTDAERAMFMQARMQREMADAANRQANMEELGRRGLGGSTLQLSNLNAGSMETGYQRALVDTQAAGYAGQRAEAALRDYGTLSSTIADQSFRRSFSTGQAADQAAQFNVNTQMQGTLGQGQMATQMRNADDAINTFNKSQRMQQQRFQDQFAADQQAQAWGRGTDMADAQFRQSENLGNRATAYTGQAMGELNARHERQADIGRSGITASGQYTQGLGQLSATQMQGLGDNSRDLSNAATLAQGIAGTATRGQLETNRFTALGSERAAADRASAQAASAASAELERQRQADAEAQERADTTGILGLPYIGSRKGLLTGFGAWG
jgi:hypothetical protein